MQTALREKCGGGSCLNIQLVSTIWPPVLHKVTCEVDNHYNCCGFTECVLQVISGACVVTKSGGVEATCIISGDRGGAHLKLIP